MVDQALAPVVGFRLLARHTHKLDAGGEDVIVCTLARGGDAGDAVGKTLSTLNRLLRDGRKVVHCYQHQCGEITVMVLMLASGA